MRVSLLFIAIYLLASMPLLAQGPIIDIGTSVTPANVLTLQDVDFVNATTPKWLFTIDLRIRNAGGGNVTSVNVVMRLTLDVVLASGESFSPASELQTKSFPVDGSRSISNLDLKQNPVYGITYTLLPEAKRRFEELALPTGFMPSGTYTFRIEVRAEVTTRHSGHRSNLSSPIPRALSSCSPWTETVRWGNSRFFSGTTTVPLAYFHLRTAARPIFSAGGHRRRAACHGRGDDQFIPLSELGCAPA